MNHQQLLTLNDSLLTLRPDLDYMLTRSNPLFSQPICPGMVMTENLNKYQPSTIYSVIDLIHDNDKLIYEAPKTFNT